MDIFNTLVSVIIPCYNQAQYLPDALNSVLAQTYTNWECIIVNDGSPDNTEEVAKEWVEKDKRFAYFIKKNGGLSDARNFGILKSKGEYILPLDSDDKIGIEYLSKAIHVLDTSDYNVVYCEAEYFGEKRGKWHLPKFSIDRFMFENLVFCSAIFRKSDFLKTEGYNVKLVYGLEDWDFWLKLIENGCKFYKIPQTLFYYRVRSDSMIHSLDEERSQILKRHIYLNHIDFYFSYLGPPQNAYKELYIIKKSFSWRLCRVVTFFPRIILKILNIR